MSTITLANFMVNGCTSFDGDLSSWDVSGITTLFSFMGAGAGLSTVNYDLLLNSWSLQSVQASVSANFGSSVYTIATSQAARDILTDAPNLWSVGDGGGV